jgi:hypothetical protein
MKNSRTVKKMFDIRLEGTKKTRRCEDGVIQDIRALREKNWRIVALNREDWLKLLKKSRVHTGLIIS